MGRRDERMKASDVFREAKFLFSRKASFDEAFPEIENVVIEVEERGDGVNHWGFCGSRRVYKNPHLPGEYIDCSNPLCYNGGVRVGSIIHEMVKERSTGRVGSTSFCQGYEGSPKGRRRYRKCTNSFKVIISITYKEKAFTKTSD